MKRASKKLLFTVLLISISLTTSFSQKNQNKLMEYRVGWRSPYYKNDVPINKYMFLSELAKDEFAYREYQNGKALCTLGYIITIPSSLVFGWQLGKVIADTEDYSETALILGGFGSVLGVVINVAGRSKMKGAIALYNSKNTSLGIKVEGNGIGLVLNF